MLAVYRKIIELRYKLPLAMTIEFKALAMLQACSEKVRCRQIEVDDLDSISSLLVKGFPLTNKSLWAEAFGRLQDRPVPDGFPRFGYMLQSRGAAVGVVLVISTVIKRNLCCSVRCSVSSWYVDPPYRNLASLLVLRAIRHQPATYINTSPAPNTLPTIEAQGFSRFTSGTFAAVPALTPHVGTARIREFDRTQDYKAHLPAEDIALLADHERYGCLCLVCETPQCSYPLILRRRRVKTGLVPAAQLLYCPSLGALQKAAGPLGRYLLRKGLPLLLIGSDGPLPLIGRYLPEKGLPMYYRGEKPCIVDLAYTELAVFGW